VDGEETRWIELPIVCPHCGNHGEEGGKWETNGPTPFRLIEDVIRSWPFSAQRDASGALLLVGDTSDDSVDWESGTNLRCECTQCFGEFPLPEGAAVDFE
jgi:hypothetical protein